MKEEDTQQHEAVMNTLTASVTPQAGVTPQLPQDTTTGIRGEQDSSEDSEDEEESVESIRSMVEEGKLGKTKADLAESLLYLSEKSSNVKYYRGVPLLFRHITGKAQNHTISSNSNNKSLLLICFRAVLF